MGDFVITRGKPQSRAPVNSSLTSSTLCSFNSWCISGKETNCYQLIKSLKGCRVIKLHAGWLPVGAETMKRQSVFLSIEELAAQIREVFPSGQFIVESLYLLLIFWALDFFLFFPKD